MAATFKRADTADTSELIGLIREFYEFERRAFNDPIVYEDHLAHAALQDLLSGETHGRAWLIRDGGETVGYVILSFGFSLESHGRCAFIDEFYVRADHRGQGLGRATLELLEGMCRELGIRFLFLEVDRANTAAQRLDGKSGFEERDNYLMRKRISE